MTPSVQDPSVNGRHRLRRRLLRLGRQHRRLMQVDLKPFSTKRQNHESIDVGQWPASRGKLASVPGASLIFQAQQDTNQHARRRRSTRPVQFTSKRRPHRTQRPGAHVAWTPSKNSVASPTSPAISKTTAWPPNSSFDRDTAGRSRHRQPELRRPSLRRLRPAAEVSTM